MDQTGEPKDGNPFSTQMWIALGVLAVLVLVALVTFGWQMGWGALGQIWLRPILLLLLVLVAVLGLMLLGTLHKGAAFQAPSMGTSLLVAFVGLIVLCGWMIATHDEQLGKFVYV